MSGERAPFTIADTVIEPGRRAKVELPIARLMSGTPVSLPLVVLHGAADGPVVWFSAAIHGDEICGVEIIRRILERTDTTTLRGTVIAVPVVNVHGFNTGDRYLPDRRDLNRSFPGSARGSLAARIAHLMMTQVVQRCSLGIDLHTGSDHRINLPQIRGDLDNPTVMEMAEIFAAPVTIDSRLRDGSLRGAAADVGAISLLYEGGEADRFDEAAIDAGTDGCLRVLAHLGMIDHAPETSVVTSRARRSRWMRASSSGVFHLEVGLGDHVEHGDTLGIIHDPFGKRTGMVTARTSGIVIGLTLRPLVNRGDAVVHVAELEVEVEVDEG